MNRVQTKIFPEMRELLIKKLSLLPIDETVRAAMIRKIKSVSYRQDGCESRSGPADLAASLSPNAFYDDANKFCLNQSLLMHAPSEFTIAHVIGHELSHALDPCGLSSGPKGTGFQYSPGATVDTAEREYPIPHLLACLRDPRSVGASSVQSTVTTGQQTAPAPQRGPRSGCPFHQHDQICEAFADWMSSEVLPMYIASRSALSSSQRRLGYSNTFRDLCSDMNGMNDPHPPIIKRINAGILVQPEIRTQMDCTAPHSSLIHCDPNNPLPEHRSDRPAAPLNSAPVGWTGQYGQYGQFPPGYGAPQAPQQLKSNPPQDTVGDR